MKLQFLWLAITQDKELYQQYTSYLVAKRTANGTINIAYVMIIAILEIIIVPE